MHDASGNAFGERFWLDVVVDPSLNNVDAPAPAAPSAPPADALVDSRAAQAQREAEIIAKEKQVNAFVACDSVCLLCRVASKTNDQTS
jgi:hypothetical protein